MPEKKRVAVLFGGHSSEYGVSLQSAASVLEEIDRAFFVPHFHRYLAARRLVSL